MGSWRVRIVRFGSGGVAEFDHVTRSLSPGQERELKDGLIPGTVHLPTRCKSAFQERIWDDSQPYPRNTTSTQLLIIPQLPVRPI